MDVGQRLHRPTIGTVAAQAHVSIKTVSRVLNNSSCVTQVTRDRVLAVIRELRFSPSPTARRLAGHRSQLIGMPFDSSAVRYVTEVQMGSVPTFLAANYQVVHHACDAYATDIVDEVMTFIQRVRVDGLILTPPLSHVDALIEALVGQAVPFVSIASVRGQDPSRSVFTDERDACAAMVGQLVADGHDRIGFVRGPANCTVSEQRYLGYVDGLQRAGLPVFPALVRQGDNSVASGWTGGRQLLTQPRSARPTAIFASNDDMAAGVLRVAHDLRLDVPGELSVAGCEDSPIASQVWPRLTTISLPIRAMAERAALLLMSQLRTTEGGQREGAPSQLVESVLIRRQSTARVTQVRAA
jgi:LacI family transcriptional regulator